MSTTSGNPKNPKTVVAANPKQTVVLPGTARLFTDGVTPKIQIKRQGK